MGFAFIKEKTFIDLALVHVMKGINHVVKAKAHRRFNELGVGDFTSVELQAGFQKLTTAGGDLFWRMFQVLAKITAERHSKLVERNQIAARLIHFIQCRCQCKFVRCDVSSKEDHTTPVVLKRRIGLIKFHR